jgi:four helix bundle protein
VAVSRFEDLIAWQRARLFCQTVYRATASDRFARDFGLQGQVRRAAVSVMANVAEGFARGSGVEFRRYLDIAIGSNAEALSHLYVALDVGYLEQTAFDSLRQQSDEVARVLRGLKAKVDARRKPRTGAGPSDAGVGPAMARPRTTNYELRTTNS